MRALLCIFSLIALASAFAPLHLKKEPVQDSYIVVFKTEVAADQLSSDLELLSALNNISYDFTYTRVLKGFSARLNKVQLSNVRLHPRIAYIEQDQTARIGCTIQNNAPWGLNRVSQRDLDLDGTYNYPDHAGQGVDAYIYDTGIRTTHVDFGGRAFFDYKVNPNWPNGDDNGHGTHVASTVGGNTYGIAKRCNLYAYKVLGPDGSGTYAGIIAAIEHSVTQYHARGRPATGNMSLGGGFSAAVNAACTNASREGIIMVVAAGNSDADACNYSPASATDVLSIVATDTAEAGGSQIDTRSYFSNFGDCTSMCAPGSDIPGAWHLSDTATRTISGTSMASPHVCGGVALYLAENPNAQFPQVSAALIGGGTQGKINHNCGGRAACLRTPNSLMYVGCL